MVLAKYILRDLTFQNEIHQLFLSKEAFSFKTYVFVFKLTFLNTKFISFCQEYFTTLMFPFLNILRPLVIHIIIFPKIKRLHARKLSIYVVDIAHEGAF